MGKLSIDLSSVTTVGLDLAKHMFFIHAIDAQGREVFTMEVRRRDLLSFFASLPACLVGMETCSSTHHWGRELMAMGHDVRLMPPAYVKPYVKRQKNDAADASAICEAVTRPSMRFVKIRSIDNQAVLMEHGPSRLHIEGAVVGSLTSFSSECAIKVPGYPGSPTPPIWQSGFRGQRLGQQRKNQRIASYPATARSFLAIIICDYPNQFGRSSSGTRAIC